MGKVGTGYQIVLPVWHQAKGVDLSHEDVGWDHVEPDVNQEGIQDLH